MLIHYDLNNIIIMTDNSCDEIFSNELDLE